MIFMFITDNNLLSKLITINYLAKQHFLIKMKILILIEWQMKVNRDLDNGGSLIRFIPKVLAKVDFIKREIQLKLLIRLQVIYFQKEKMMKYLNQQFKYYCKMKIKKRNNFQLIFIIFKMNRHLRIFQMH